MEKNIRIGILRATSIGDVVLATSCLTLLNQLGLGVEVTWIGRNPALSLIQSVFPHVNGIEILPTTPLTELTQKLSHLDLLLDLQGNLRTRLLLRAFRRTFKKPVFSSSKMQIYRSRLILEGRLYGRKRTLPETSLHAFRPQYTLMAGALLEALQNEKFVEKKLSLNLLESRPTFPIERSDKRKMIAIAPGASYPTKRAPLEIFKKILTNIHDGVEEPTDLCFLGDKNDAEICHELNQSINWQKGQIHHLAGTLSLYENALTLAKTSYLLSNDSSLSHIAEAVKTPVGVLFGPTVEGFGFAPHLKESRAFSVPLGCRPCSKHGKSPCRFYDLKCFWDLDVTTIAEHALHHLK